MRPFHIVTILFLLASAALLWQWRAGSASLWWLIPLFVLYTIPLVLGAIYIRWNFYFKSFDKGTNKEWITLTFDDGPASQTAAILDILKVQGVPAAFFSIGRNAAANPDLVRRWATEGHIIGNHSYHHGFNFDWKSAKAMAAEIEETNQTINSITGLTPKLFRPPYGVTNPNLGKAIRKTGMHSIGWNIRSFDTTAKEPAQLLARILDQLTGGDIILLHDSMPLTREILTELIVRARQKGFTFVALDKMLDLNAYA